MNARIHICLSTLLTLCCVVGADEGRLRIIGLSSVSDPLSKAKLLYPMHYTGRVTPAPRKVLSKWEIVPFSRNRLAIMIESEAHPSIVLARDLLLQRVRAYSENALDSAGGELDVFLGELDSAYIRELSNKLSIPLNSMDVQPQGYVIRRKGTTIIAAGVDAQGTFHAAMTLYQSIGALDGRLVLRCADLDDWPAWPYRYFASYPIPSDHSNQALLFLAMHKLGGISIQTRGRWRNILPDSPAYAQRKSYESALTALQEFNERYELLNSQLVIHIYARSDPLFDITNEKDISRLAETCVYVASRGIGSIMISADDWTPKENGRYVCRYPSERRQFKDSVGRAHGYLMRRLHNVLRTRFPEVTLSFVPAPYSLKHNETTSRASNHRYLRDMAQEMPDDVFVLWTGPAVRSWDITREHFLEWQDCLNNSQRSYIWDNTTVPPEIRRWSTTFYEGFNADSQGVIFINGNLFGRHHRIPVVLNANDYLWNPRGYQENLSYHDVVEKLFGPGTGDTADEFITISSDLLNTDLPRKTVLQLLDRLDALSSVMKEDGWKTMHLVDRVLRAARERADVVVPVLNVSHFGTPPVMDGRLDDACWKEGSPVEFVRSSDKKGKRETATFRIGYDKTFLYLGFFCQRTEPLNAPMKLKHDERVWASEDCIELFLQGEKDAYAQLVFDAFGNQADLGFGAADVHDWNPKWRVCIHADNGNDWFAEVAIPLCLAPIIEKPVEPGTVWRANFIRNVHKTNPSAWSPPKSNGNHAREMFGKLVFKKK